MLKGKRTKSCRLTAWMSEWVSDWLTDRPTDWLTDWLIDWLTVDGAWGCIAFPNVKTACWAETNNLHENYRNEELMNKSKFPQSRSISMFQATVRLIWSNSISVFYVMCRSWQMFSEFGQLRSNRQNVLHLFFCFSKESYGCEAVFLPDVDYFGDNYRTRSNPKKHEEKPLGSVCQTSNTWVLRLIHCWRLSVFIINFNCVIRHGN